MSMAHPTLTHIYIVLATAVLLGVQLPLLALALLRRAHRDPHVRFAAALIIGTALANAVLYAIGNGLQNVRYALPASMLISATIVWANAAMLTLLWRAPATAERHIRFPR